MTTKQINLKSFIDLVAYVAWSLALWVLSYYHAVGYKFEDVSREYLKAYWYLLTAAIILYGNSWKVLVREIFVSVSILVGSSIFEIYYGQAGNLKQIIGQIIIFACYQLFAGLAIVVISKWRTVCESHEKKLAILFMVVIGGLYFVFNANCFIALFSASIIQGIVAYGYYLKGNGGNLRAKYKVKYKAGIYYVDIFDKFRIEWIKCILIIKRIKRRGTMLIPKNILLYLVLTLCWIFFGALTYRVGVLYKEPEVYTVKNVIWELKNSYFTSVVLALLIAGYSQNSGYRKQIEMQHDFYVDVMTGFDHLFEAFIGDEIYYYMPFYNNLCLQGTLEYINECEGGRYEFSKDAFRNDLERISDLLDRVEQEARGNNIIGMHKQELRRDIQRAKDLIRKNMRQDLEFEQIKEELHFLAYQLFHIIADLRRPWRWDIDNDVKILQILDTYEENNIKDDFYYRMHLYGHIFEHES